MLCCLGMQAQEFCLKPVLGGNVSTLTGGKGKGKTEVGVVGGLEGEYRFNPGFSLSAAVLYSQEGCSDDESSDIEIYSPYGHAARLGRMNLVKVPILKGTVPHEIEARFGGAQVFLKPASEGTGLVAGGAMRAVLESVGVKDVLAKSKGSSNPHNLVKATILALSQMRDAYTVAGIRGVSMDKVFNG